MSQQNGQNKNTTKLISDSSIITENNSIQDDQMLSSQKKTFIQRAFSPMRDGSMRGSIFALLASAMGTGMFNLPYRVSQIGLVPFIAYVFIGGFFSYIGMYLISRLILKFKVNSYSQMSEKTYGSKFRKLAQFCIIIYPWGITVCYQVIFAKFIIQLLDDNFDLGFYEASGRSAQIYSDKGNLVRVIVTVAGVLINLFFILKKQIGILQKISIIGVASVLINTVILLILFLVGFSETISGESIKYSGVTGIKWGDLNWFSADGWTSLNQHIQALSSIIFCYVNHQLVFPLIHDVKNPTKRRLDKIFLRVHRIQIFVYNCIGFSGYLLLSEHIKDYQINAIVMGSILTPVMAFGKVLLVAACFFAVPLNLFPARQSIYQAFGFEKSNKNHIIISLSLALSGTLIACVFVKVNSYFGLLGGTAGVMMAGLIPTICYWKLKGLRTLNQKLLVIFMCIISFFGGIGAILSVVT